MNIREVIDGDFDGIWPIFHHIVKVGETYAYPKKSLSPKLEDPQKT